MAPPVRELSEFECTALVAQIEYEAQPWHECSWLPRALTEQRRR